MTVDVVYRVQEIADYPTTREQGRSGRAELDRRLAGQREVDLTVSFEGVAGMTHSFIDEFLGRFLSLDELERSAVTLKVMSLSPENLETLEVCLERRNQLVAHVEPSQRLSLVASDQVSRDTFDAVTGAGPCTAAEVAKLLKTTPQNANNRLRRLSRFGVVRKSQVVGGTRGGKEFRYTPVPSELPAQV